MKEQKTDPHSSKHSPKRPLRREANPFLKYTSIGFQMIATILLGVWLGVYLDDRYETENPWFTVGCSLFAVVASIYLSVKELIK